MGFIGWIDWNDWQIGFFDLIDRNDWQIGFLGDWLAGRLNGYLDLINWIYWVTAWQIEAFIEHHKRV